MKKMVPDKTDKPKQREAPLRQRVNWWHWCFDTIPREALSPLEALILIFVVGSSERIGGMVHGGLDTLREAIGAPPKTIIRALHKLQKRELLYVEWISNDGSRLKPMGFCTSRKYFAEVWEWDGKQSIK